MSIGPSLGSVNGVWAKRVRNVGLASWSNFYDEIYTKYNLEPVKRLENQLLMNTIYPRYLIFKMIKYNKIGFI